MKGKKCLSIALSGILFGSIMTYMPQHIFDCNVSITAYATDKTVDEAISWVQSKLGSGIDYDGANGNQCVDLILAYYNYLGVSPASGNGKDYATNALPSGWRRIAGATPQNGDILVYGASSGNPYGHVAIYEGDYATYHQNFNSHSYVEKITNIKYNGFTNPYWGVIRPNFSTVIAGPELPESQAAGRTIPDGDYLISAKQKPTLFLDPAPGSDYPAASSSNVAVTEYTKSIPDFWDSWTFTYLNNGFY